MKGTICIYHGGCDDGFGAAWAVRHALGEENVEYYPGVYNKPPPDVAGRNVIMVDFSYKRDVLNAMLPLFSSLLILDHHKTAEEDLRGFGFADPRIKVVFDMERSGAGIAWDHFHPDKQRPVLINYLEDRDLWKKQLAGGDEFTIALRSYPQDFKTWDELFAVDKNNCCLGIGVNGLIEQGLHIQRYYRLQVEKLKDEAYAGLFNLDAPAGHFVNAPYAFASEVAGEIAFPGSFGACYFQRGDGRWQYSLRSDGFDVSAIARAFGGGGHHKAAGFDTDLPVHSRVR